MFKDDRPLSIYRREILLRLETGHQLLTPLLDEARADLDRLRGSEDPEDVKLFLDALKKVSFLTDLVELFELKNKPDAHRN